MQNDILDILRLIRSSQVGPITYHKLIRRFATPADALAALPDMAKRSGSPTGLKICPVEEAEKELQTCQKKGIDVLSMADPAYPPRLKHIEDAPPLLFVKGNPDILTKKSVAVIGSRNASSNGLRFAHKISADLGHSGLLITSGMARGIDTAAHEGALDSGTVAVLGGGVDVVYPRENQNLYDEISEKGAIVSEMPVGTRPKAAHFPRRNRIISGISRGIVVVEAAPRSGSLITARLALEQGRDVFAVPGAAMDPRARGTNSLIRQGAILTETADDVLEALGPEYILPTLAPAPVDDFSIHTPETGVDQQPGSKATESDLRDLVYHRLNTTPIEADDLAREFSVAPAILNEILMDMELAGTIERHPGNRVSALLPV